MLCIAGHIGCHTSVLNIVDDSCSGKQNCKFEVGSNLDERDDLSPCPEGLKMYLEATYACVKGIVVLLVWFYLHQPCLCRVLVDLIISPCAVKT